MKIEHMALYVKDLEEAKTFFVRFFEGKTGNIYHNEKTGFSSYFISFSDGSRLELMTRKELEETTEEKPLIFPGYVHIAFSVGSKERVDRLTEELVSDGYELVSGPRMTGDGYYESCIKGIEGNLIEITV